MSQLPNERLQWDALSVGTTRPAMLKGVPFAFIPIIFFAAAGVVFLTWNPLWLLLMVPMTIAARVLVSRDYNMPRVLWLWLQSGSAFTDRSAWGGESPNPGGPPDAWFGILYT